MRPGCAVLVVGALLACGDNRSVRDDGGSLLGDADDGGDGPVDAGVDGVPDAPPDAPPRCGDGHVDPGEECDQAIAGLASDGCSAACTHEPITWTNLTPNPAPRRAAHAVAYDSVRHRLVLFGGQQDYQVPTNETWEWDGTTWTQKLTLVVPPARSGHAMVFDEGRQRVLLFGGAGTNGALNDTWEWDGTTWTQRSAVTSPLATLRPLMAYDGLRGVTVLCSDDGTWEWNGTTWSQRSTTFPALQDYTDLVYAGSAGVMLLEANKNWLWNGTSWSSINFSAQVPWSNAPVAATYDTIRGRVQAVGYHASQTERMSVWEWTNNNWVRQAPNGETGVPHAWMTDVAYDPDHAITLLFGGWAFNYESMAQLWEWNGSSWREHYGAGPAPRSLPLMTYDARRARIVMFGGMGRGPLLADTWEWDGSAWLLRASSGPAARSGTTITYDERRGRVVMFGGMDIDHQTPGASAPVPFTDTWEWNGTTWQQLFPTPTPTASLSMAMTYDRVHGYTLLFTSGETWTWDGLAWTQRVTNHVPVADPLTPSMSYDARRGVPVLYTRIWNTSTNEVWEWSGNDWILKSSASPAFSVFYDPLRARVILEDGFQQGKYWTWDGVTPSLFESTNVNYFGFGIGFDRAKQRWFSFGGFSGWDTLTATAGANEARDACDGSDVDGDGLTRCADPDCWWRCTPLCAPGETFCDPLAPKCGDGTCSSLEGSALCPTDCP
jgi:cysteine-rich repeat protein